MNQNATFSQIGFQLHISNASVLPVALEQISGPLPRWKIPSIDSRVPQGLQWIYVVDISEPFTLALIRDVDDFPLLLRELLYFRRDHGGSCFPALASFKTSATTVGGLVGARLKEGAREWACVRLLSGTHDIQQLPCESVQKEIKEAYSTTIFALSTDDPLAYKFRNTYGGRVPVPLQLVFPQCRSLVESAPRLKAFSFQAIEFSRALLHLAICLTEAVVEMKIEGATQAYLISLQKSMAIKLKGIFTDIEGSTGSPSPAVVKSLHYFFFKICEEQPGVVSVRQSLDSLITPDLWSEEGSSEIHGMNLMDQYEDVLEQRLIIDDSASSDSLSISDHESISQRVLRGIRAILTA